MLDFPRAPWRALPLLLVAFAGMAGCKDRGVTTYRIPKENEGAPAAMAPADADAASGPRWTAPAGWQSQPASGMRLGSFLISGPGGAKADVSIITFPGTGGDDLANVNRWRGQLQLPPIGAEALAAELHALEAPAGQFAVADMAGAAASGGPPTRILGAWLREGGTVWFIKMMGPSDLVGAQKEAFLDFLQSFAPTGGAPVAPAVRSAGAAPNTNDLPPGHPALPGAAEASGGMGDMNAMPVRSAEVPALRWRAPADWRDKPGSAMRKGSYAVGDAEVAITVFPGDVGGVLANVNRWRGQVGLPTIAETGLAGSTTAVDAHGLHFVVADASGSSSRIVAALLPWQGATWFFKLTGPSEAVGRAKPAFLEFLQTVQVP